jgi:hypothetical protein
MLARYGSDLCRPCDPVNLAHVAFRLATVAFHLPSAGGHRAAGRLYLEQTGDFVRKHMDPCTGAEILEEVLRQLRFDQQFDAIMASSICIRCNMPYVDNMWLPRTRTDRPCPVQQGYRRCIRDRVWILPDGPAPRGTSESKASKPDTECHGVRDGVARSRSFWRFARNYWDCHGFLREAQYAYSVQLRPLLRGTPCRACLPCTQSATLARTQSAKCGVAWRAEGGISHRKRDSVGC